MLLPQLNVKRLNSIPLNQFGGINLNNSVPEGEFADVRNMTNDLFPILSNRRKRGILRTIKNPMGMIGGTTLCHIEDNKFYYDESVVDDVLLEDTDMERTMVRMGAYVVIFPDGVIYNTFDGSVSYISNETTSDNVTITLSKLDGTPFDSTNTNPPSPSEPSDRKKYWIDTSNYPVVMKTYSEASGMWVSVPTTYVKFSAPGIGVGFKKYDAVYCEGVDEGEWIYNGIKFNGQDLIVYDCGNDFILVAGFINLQHSNTQTITLKRRYPKMDFVCENDNRIWGCSSDTHEIFACKQGDPTNWFCYAGLVTDSYAATVGTQNQFTGCVSYGGYIYFFKEDGYHKVYGNKPSNFEIQWKPGVGVQQGSEKSISVSGDYLIIKARDGFYMYDGSFSPISERLGAEPFYEAVGASYRGKYYVSMRDNDYNYRIYVYDIKKGMWTCEDDIKARYIVYTNNGLYILPEEYETDEDDNRYYTLFATHNEDILVKIFPSDTSLGDTYIYPNDSFFCGNVIKGDVEGLFEWAFTTGDIDLQSDAYKYLMRIVMRMWLDTNAKMKIEINYDSSDEWLNVMEIYCSRKRSYEIPIQVTRCDHFRIRFSGFGDMKLFSLTKVVEGGSTT